MVHGRLIPGGDCAAILSNLPPGMLSIDDVLANHTLLPYYTRFFEANKSSRYGRHYGLAVGQVLPVCGHRCRMARRGSNIALSVISWIQKKYGEPFWHRVHQIPLLGYCPMHKIPLVTVPIKFARLSEVFLPLISVHCQDTVEGSTESWMDPLADMIAALLYGDYTPTVGYSNLHTALINAGYGVDKISEHQALSVAKIQQAARAYWGEQIYEQYFACMSNAVLSRLDKMAAFLSGTVCTARCDGWNGFRRSVWSGYWANRPTAGKTLVLQGGGCDIRQKRSGRKDGYTAWTVGLPCAKV